MDEARVQEILTLVDALVHAERFDCETVEYAALETALRGAKEPEPFGYVLEMNVPESSPYKRLFYLPEQVATAYKDNALRVITVYRHPEQS